MGLLERNPTPPSLTPVGFHSAQVKAIAVLKFPLKLNAIALLPCDRLRL
ncbi:hypothetical protein VB854_10710 [Limnoraphis robusta CCNP1315]|uniref:Uncharacterized protein n=1 Tax=Limnoraphis robusta CCNP1315 TaxID=3110306 RepID=A0ABU5TZW0_9CYAN|nr:hypothetical protein [Limnoraphis robusta]MEA5519418.1 hypothetical protein [Limnoraphis robusta CCNP1315]MEA5549126.1 hypothetical protein [Limnoraphis robusta CCNP1324]